MFGVVNLYICIVAYLHAYILANCMLPYLHTCILAYFHTCTLAYLHACMPAYLERALETPLTALRDVQMEAYGWRCRKRGEGRERWRRVEQGEGECVGWPRCTIREMKRCPRHSCFRIRYPERGMFVVFNGSLCHGVLPPTTKLETTQPRQVLVINWWRVQKGALPLP